MATREPMPMRLTPSEPSTVMSSQLPPGVSLCNSSEGASAHQLLESGREGPEAGEPNLEADVGDAGLGGEDEPLGLLESQRRQELPRRDADHVAKQAGEMERAVVRHLGELIEHGPTRALFNSPTRTETESYVTGKFG